MKVKTLRLHVGIHETGTEALQSVLQGGEDELRDSGVFYLEEQTYRQAFRNALIHGEIGDREVVQKLIEELSFVVPSNYETVILSDENLLGPMLYNLTSRQFYARAQNRLELCRNVFEAETVEIFMGLISYDTYFNKVYSRSAMTRELNDFAFLKKRLLEQKDRALEIVGVLEKVFGERAFSIWFQETMSDHEKRIAESIAGMTLSNQFLPLRDMSPSKKAVELMREAMFEEDPNVGAAMADHFISNYPVGPYDPPQYWNEDEQAQLKTQYREDIDQLSQRANIRFLTEVPAF